MRFEPYEGKEDAEKILEKVMRRRNWTANVRDDLARALEKIVSDARKMK